MSRTRTRTRWRIGLTATALLVASTALPAGPANAEDVTDYAITVDPKTKGAKIDDTMYGVFFEDINRAADGGLYAELVQNRSFEYSTDLFDAPTIARMAEHYRMLLGRMVEDPDSRIDQSLITDAERDRLVRGPDADVDLEEWTL